MADKVQVTPSIIRRKQVEARTGLSRSSIYAAIKAGTFPAPIYLGEKSVGWLDSEIDGWIASRVSASRAPIVAHRSASLRTAQQVTA